MPVPPASAAALADAAVIVITHNSGAVLDACLESIAGACVETVVVDNASTDDSTSIARRFALSNAGVSVIANAWNRGFAGAVNDGFRATRAECVLLLNPDAALLAPRDLRPLTALCKQYGLASGLLVGMDGKPQRGFFARALPTPASLAFEALGLNRLWPSNPVNRRYRCFDLSPGEETFVEQPPGAFLMIRRDVWQALGGFDESFHPVWFEDADFCRRAVDAGYRIRFTPACVVCHEGGHSVLRVEDRSRGLFWYGSLLRYAAKHFKPLGFGAVCAAVAAGSVGRALTGVIYPADWGKSVQMYGSILRLAVGSLFAGKVPPVGRRQADGQSVISAVEQ